jgi:hypothetical protein
MYEREHDSTSPKRERGLMFGPRSRFGLVESHTHNSNNRTTAADQ